MNNRTVPAVLGYVPPQVYVNMASEHFAKADRFDDSPNGRIAAEHLRAVGGRYFAIAADVHNLSK